MDEKQAVMRPIDQVRGELDAKFRTGAEIAERLGMPLQVVGGPLGMLRRNGEAEGMLGARGESLWRRASGGDPHDPRSARARAGAWRGSPGQPAAGPDRVHGHGAATATPSFLNLRTRAQICAPILPLSAFSVLDSGRVVTAD